MRHALDRPILFVGGKGGVGKTTLAAAFSLLSAKRGNDTLLVSTDPAHSTADLLETPVGSEPTPVRERLWAMEIDPEREADAYIASVKAQIEASTAPRLMDEVERQIDIARVSPGAEEAALFERFSRILDEDTGRFARIVFDTAPTGHTLRLISLPELMTAWMHGLVQRRKKVGALNRMWRNVAGAAAGSASPGDPVLDALTARKRRFQAARRRLVDPDVTTFVFVVTPERLPILETEKATRALERYRIPLAGVVVNRVLPGEANGAFLQRRKQREAAYRDEIAQRFGARVLFEVPLLDRDIVGLGGLDDLTAHLPAAYRA